MMTINPAKDVMKSRKNLTEYIFSIFVYHRYSIKDGAFNFKTLHLRPRTRRITPSRSYRMYFPLIVHRVIPVFSLTQSEILTKNRDFPLRL